MEILKSLFRSIVRLVAINIALILFFASAPLLYVTVPFWVILTHKSVADMATIYMLTGPVRVRVLDDCDLPLANCASGASAGSSQELAR